MATNDETIDVLNELIETSKDGEYGFATCAEYAKSPDLQALFMQRAAQCRQAAEELQRHVVQLGGEPDTGGSASGAMHRGWVAVRATLASYNDPAMLEECERGEDAAVERYADALKEDLPPATRTLVNAQYQGARRNHDQIRNLRDQLKETS